MIKSIFLALKFKTLLPLYMKKYGDCLEIRDQKQIQKSFNVVSQIYGGPVEERAQNILYFALKKHSVSNKFIFHLKDTFFRVKFI